ncbi:MAG: hypothetical protein OEZ06_27980, partial [Myxococcales bacterium]|nr:hypothetical protein [Myxococcales bacterium]
MPVPVLVLRRNTSSNLLVAQLACALAAVACTETVQDPLAGDSVDFEPDRPAVAEVIKAEPYTGDNPYVLEAQAKLPTGIDLQTDVVQRTCGPTGGVCHNAKEYPDLHTPANLIGS